MEFTSIALVPIFRFDERNSITVSIKHFNMDNHHLLNGNMLLDIRQKKSVEIFCLNFLIVFHNGRSDEL